MRVVAVLTIACLFSFAAASRSRSPYDCTSAFAHAHDDVREGRIEISSWEGCMMGGTIAGAYTVLYADGNCELRAKVPGTFNIRYDATCGQVLELSTGPLSPYCAPTPTPAPAPSATPTPTPEPTPCARRLPNGKCRKS